MKTIGIIGGLSHESTITYYRALNEGARKRRGGHHTAKILISSVDFGAFTDLKENGDWDTQGRLLAAEAQALERAGADFIILATNTMHKVAPVIESAISIPFLHLADATASRISGAGLKTVLLLGTRYTMEMDFYKDRLTRQGITAMIPDAEGRSAVNGIIYDELCHGLIRPESKDKYSDIIRKAFHDGAEGVILGCTEIAMLIGQDDSPVPVFDTARIHVEEALKFALGE